MRVLHLYAGNLFGGIERLLVTLAHERGDCPEMQPEFGLCFDGRVAQELRAEGVPVHMLGEVRFSRPWTIWHARARLRDLLRHGTYDAAICHACWPHAVFGPTVQEAGVPLVFWAHDTPAGTHWLERLAARIAPVLVLANSKFTLSAVPRLFPNSRTELLYYPVTIPDQNGREKIREEVRAEFKAPPQRVVIAIACRMEKWKGHRLLLEGLGRLAQGLDWECWVIGGSQRPHERAYLDELRSLAEKLGISSRLNFLGQRSDVSRLLCGADIHCQPNTGPEPFGIAFIEALGAGLPVVTTSLGAAPEIVTNDCGILVPPDDSHMLANSLSAIMTNSQQRAVLGAAGPSRAHELCDPASRIQALHELLSTITGPHLMAERKRHA